jgi:hypothetical protein
MKKHILLSAILCLTIFICKAQKTCGTNFNISDSIFLLKQSKQEIITNNYKNNGSSNKNGSIIVNIPIIIHVLHNGGVENIPDDRIQSQIDILNKDFQLLNDDANSCPNRFKPVQANCQISFCIARIIRKQTHLTEVYQLVDDAMYSLLGGDDIVDSDKYLNIWIVPKIRSTTFQEIEGYTNPPGSNSSKDGVVIKYSEFGSNVYTAGKGRTATHEIGHWLNLNHIWGNSLPIFTCTGDDGVDDTPKQDNATSECPDVNNPPISCNNGPNGNMFMNYMDYTDDECMNMFTLGQKDRMLALFEQGGLRESILLNNQNCMTLKPDLFFFRTTISKDTINAGGILTTTHKIKNKGTGNAPISTTAIWLSKDQYFNAQIDINLGADVTVQPLKSGDISDTLFKNITIPQSTSSGLWYIMFGCDADDANPISESDESNNQRFIPITITNTSTNCTSANFLITPSTNWLTHPNSHAANDSRTYRVPVVSGNVYTFKTGCGNGATANYDTYLELFNSSCATVKVNDDSCETRRSAISVTANFTGYAYLKVSGYGGQGGNYTLAYKYNTCTGWYTSPSSNNFTSVAGSGSFTAYATQGGGCAFFAVNNNPDWIKNITFPGNGVVRYTIDANYGPARNGSISLKDVNNVIQATYYIYQDEGSICRTCPSYDLSLSPATYWQTTENSHIENGCKIYRIYVNSGSIYTFKTGCDDGATANYDTYLELLNNNCSIITYDDDECEFQRSSITWKATYSGYVYLKVRGFGGTRGNYTLAYNYNICTNWQVNPTSESFLPNGGSSSFDVTTQYGGCGYSAVSNNSWINNITLSAGFVSYVVDVNPDAARTGTISVFDDENNIQRTFTIFQDAGSVCTSCPSSDLTITPTTNWQLHSSNHGSNGCKLYRVPVTTGKIYTFKTGCGDDATADYDTYLSLYNNSCTNIAVNDDGCSDNNRSIITWSSTYNGYVYLKVLGFDNSNGIYTLAYNYTTCSNPSQPGTISGINSVCQNSSQTYSVNPVAGATNYLWSLPSGWSGNSTSNTITVTPGSAGGTISVYAINDCGNSTTRTLSVNVTQIPSKPGNISGNYMSVCQGSSQTYSIVPVSGATSYTWYLPSGWIGSSTSTSINSTIGNSDGIIYVSANNDCGNSNVQLIDISVSKIPSLQGVISGLTLINQESSETYTINDIVDATSYNWTWPIGWFINFGQGTNSINLKTGANSGQICAYPINFCGSGIPTCLSVEVNQTTSITGPTFVTPSSSSNYIINSDNADSYIWTVPQGWIINSGQGTSTVNITVGNGFGQICVTPVINGISGIQTCINVNIVTGIYNKTNLYNISIYPNPNNGEFIIELDLIKSSNCQINITNMLGQKVYEETIFVSNLKNKIPIQLSGIANGAYNVSLIINNENYTKQIIITK